MRHLETGIHIVLIFILPVVAGIQVFLGILAVGGIGHLSEFALRTEVTVGIHVVGSGGKVEFRILGERHGKHFGKVAVVGAGSQVGVYNGVVAVLLLKTYVEHVVVLIHAAVHQLAVERFFVVHLYLIHGVGGQILKSLFGVTLKEVAAVNEQRTHRLAVHLNHAFIIECGARHLPYKGIEHAALREFKGIGIVHDGVAVHHHLYLGGLHGNSIQHGAFGLQRYGFFKLLVHLPGYIDFYLLVKGFVAKVAELEQVVTVPGHFYFIHNIGVTKEDFALRGYIGRNHTTVFNLQQLHRNGFHCLACFFIAHRPEDVFGRCAERTEQH